jgi:hypothetical protein
VLCVHCKICGQCAGLQPTGPRLRRGSCQMTRQLIARSRAVVALHPTSNTCNPNFPQPAATTTNTIHTQHPLGLLRNTHTPVCQANARMGGARLLLCQQRSLAAPAATRRHGCHHSLATAPTHVHRHVSCPAASAARRGQVRVERVVLQGGRAACVDRAAAAAPPPAAAAAAHTPDSCNQHAPAFPSRQLHSMHALPQWSTRQLVPTQRSLPRARPFTPAGPAAAAATPAAASTAAAGRGGCAA